MVLGAVDEDPPNENGAGVPLVAGAAGLLAVAGAPNENPPVEAGGVDVAAVGFVLPNENPPAGFEAAAAPPKLNPPPVLPLPDCEPAAG